MVMVASMSLVPITGNALSLDSLVSWYEFDETSGIRYDKSATSTNDLTDNNTVLYGTGKKSNGADFEASSNEYLSITDASQVGYETTGSFSFATWFYPETINVNHGLITKSDGSISANGDFYLYIENTNKIYCFWINSANNNYATYYTTNAQITTASTWYHIVIVAKVSSGSCEVYVNGTSQTMTTYRSQTTKTAGGTGSVEIGSLISSSIYTDGIFDMTSFWTRELSSTDVTELYNSGDGKTYDEFWPSGSTSTTSTSTATTTTSTIDVSELIWVVELYLSLFAFLIFTYVGYRFTKLFI